MPVRTRIQGVNAVAVLSVCIACWMAVGFRIDVQWGVAVGLAMALIHDVISRPSRHIEIVSRLFWAVMLFAVFLWLTSIWHKGAMPSWFAVGLIVSGVAAALNFGYALYMAVPDAKPTSSRRGYW